MSAPSQSLAEWIVRVAVVQGAVVVLIFVGVILLHAIKTRDLRRRKVFYDRWRPILVQGMVEAPAAVPSIAKNEVRAFLYYWNYFHQSLLGEEKMTGLNHIARMTKMDCAARRLLSAANVRDKLLAIATLGRLRDQSMWEEFVRLTEAVHPQVSLAAARALLQLDPKGAMDHLVRLMGSRLDWSPAKVTSMLNDVGSDLVAQPLAEAAATASPEVAVRLIHQLKESRSVEALPAIRRLVATTPDSRVRAACLNLLGKFADPRDLETVRRSLRDTSPEVRGEATTALGQMGIQGDEERLTALLADVEWDVRYRAAEAIVALPFMTPERVAHLERQLSNPEAKQMVATCFQRRQGLL